MFLVCFFRYFCAEYIFQKEEKEHKGDFLWGFVLLRFTLVGVGIAFSLCSYFEGRKNTEILNSVLNLAIICAGALARAVGDG